LSSGSRRATIDVVVELSRNQVPPTLPFELRDLISPNTWEARLSALAQLVSMYCRPALERVYLLVILVLTFLIPITTYYVSIQALQDTTTDSLDKEIWFARFSSFAATLATWVVLSVPWIVWKFIGKLRVARLVDQWTREDALAGPSYGAAPIWMASSPGLFRDAVELMVTVPVTKRSHFDRDSYLPPYVSAGDDALPAYTDPRMASWSKDIGGAVKYGDLPIYTEDKLTMV